MEIFKLADMKKGWFVGDFEPTCHKIKEVEVAYRSFEKGAKESKHVHKIATEFTVITKGKVIINDQELQAGDIVKLNPGEAADFKAMTDGAVVVVKTPSVPGDKYEVND